MEDSLSGGAAYCGAGQGAQPRADGLEVHEDHLHVVRAGHLGGLHGVIVGLAQQGQVFDVGALGGEQLLDGMVARA